MFSYTVTCEFDNPAVADEWIAWLREEHLRDVCEAGATNAEVVVVDNAPREAASGVVCEVRYHFPDRGAFEDYERDHAPDLREEGLKRFPLERGLRYTRRTGEIAAQYPEVQV